jgi:hypothetical protein
VGKPFRNKESACVSLIINADRSHLLASEFDVFPKQQHKARIAPKENAIMTVT